MRIHTPKQQAHEPVQLELNFAPGGLVQITPHQPVTDWRVARDLLHLIRLSEEQPITQLAVVATLADGSLLTGWTAEYDVFAMIGGLAQVQRRISETIE